MNNEPTLADMLMTVLPDAHPITIAALERAIRAEIVRLMDERDDNAYLAAVAPHPEPPAFAVGTRVRVLVDDGEVKVGQEGVITEIDDDVSYSTDKVIYTVKVEGVDGLCDFDANELEPLPAEPAALPEGVTRDADTDRITYSINVDAYENFVLRWNFETKLVSIMPHSDIVIAELSELKAIVAAGQALIAEIEAQS